MTREHFLLRDKIEQINTMFVNSGWITVYENASIDTLDRGLIFCGLLRMERLDEYLKTNEWKIELGKEGKPTIIEIVEEDEKIDIYHSTNPNGLEPLIFYKSFSHSDGHDTYIDISEEYLLYFNLYERGVDKQNRKYYRVDEGGELEEVIRIEAKSVMFKLKYLKEYLAIRKLFLSVCFSFDRFVTFDQIGGQMDEQLSDFVSEKANYHHFIRPIDAFGADFQSSIYGKVIVKYDETVRAVSHFNRAYQYEKFGIGYDENGVEVFVFCNDEWHGDRMVFFKKEVLDRYHNDPGRFKVDRFSVSSDFFSISVDNDLKENVAVRLRDLMSLPYREQQYWKSFNIIGDYKISNSFVSTMYLGNWDADIDSPDLRFKEIYVEFNNKWEKKFGWPLFKALTNENMLHYTSLHVPTTNNQKSFLAQMLSLVIITIDSLNQKCLPDKPENYPEGNVWGSLDALEAFISSKNMEGKDIIEFLRQLQKLRSKTGAAHRVSDSDSRAVNAVKRYFGINNDNLAKVASEILNKMIWVFNTLDDELINARS